jgi:hypothetical protein
MTTKIKPGDTAVVGDTVFEKTDDGVIKQEVVVVEKFFNRGGVEAKIVELQNLLNKFQTILTEIDKVIE